MIKIFRTYKLCIQNIVIPTLHLIPSMNDTDSELISFVYQNSVIPTLHLIPSINDKDFQNL